MKNCLTEFFIKVPIKQNAVSSPKIITSPPANLKASAWDNSEETLKLPQSMLKLE